MNPGDLFETIAIRAVGNALDLQLKNVVNPSLVYSGTIGICLARKIVSDKVWPFVYALFDDRVGWFMLHRDSVRTL
jgi:hypothetical protein